MNYYINTTLITAKINDINVHFKMECDQPTGSFKIRGMNKLIAEYKKSGVTEIISSSGGNAGYSAAYIAQKLNLKCTVIVPEYTSQKAKDLILSTGAEVIVHGAIWQDANEKALELVQEKNAGHISPFDHPLLWEGHASLIEECAAMMDEPEAIAVAVGGGGLLCGVLEGMKKVGWNSDIISCETKGAASFNKCLETGKWEKLDSINTIAGSLGAKQVAEQAYKEIQNFNFSPNTVSDQTAIKSAIYFHKDFKEEVEVACGAALSSVYYPNHNYNSVLVIACGGIGNTISELKNLVTEQ